MSGALPKLPSATQSSASVWFDHYNLINYAEERGELPAYELHDLTGLALSPGTGQQALLADIKAWLTRRLTLHAHDSILLQDPCWHDSQHVHLDKPMQKARRTNCQQHLQPGDGANGGGVREERMVCKQTDPWVSGSALLVEKSRHTHYCVHRVLYHEDDKGSCATCHTDLAR